jgi:uncharacterized protein
LPAHCGGRNISRETTTPARAGERSADGSAGGSFRGDREDGEKLRGFFGDLFGWKFEVNDELNYGSVSREGNGDIGIPGGVGGMPPGLNGHVTFYVEVPDVEAALAKAESLGGTRLMGPVPLPNGPTLGQFADPEGRMIGVIQSQA